MSGGVSGGGPAGAKRRELRGVYLVTDEGLCRGRDVVEVVKAAVAGGACAVQLREKSLDTRAFVERGRAVARAVAGSGVPLYINDRVDVALACGAHGVHVGQRDMCVDDVRRLVGRDLLVGLSVETIAEVRAANALDVDYVAVSPVFDTATKTDTSPAWGVAGVTEVVAASRHPVVAIGGLNEATVGDVARAGCLCMAVVSAVCSAADPHRATADLIQVIEREGKR